MVRAIIFDFDGLILDTESPIFDSLAWLYERHGQVLDPEFWATVIGHGSGYFDPWDDLEQRIGGRLDRETLRAEMLAHRAELLTKQAVLPGVVEWRAEAAELGLRQGLASSSSRGWVMGHLERLGLGQGWDCVRCSDDVTATKPDPELYLAVLDCLGMAAGEVVAVEDSAPGVTAARAAGVRCVAVPSAMTAGTDLSQADLRLESLAEIPLVEALRRLNLRPAPT